MRRMSIVSIFSFGEEDASQAGILKGSKTQPFRTLRLRVCGVFSSGEEEDANERGGFRRRKQQRL